MGAPRHCPVTGDVNCDCGACEPDEDERPAAFAVPFREPAADDAA